MLLNSIFFIPLWLLLFLYSLLFFLSISPMQADVLHMYTHHFKPTEVNLRLPKVTSPCPLPNHPSDTYTHTHINMHTLLLYSYCRVNSCCCWSPVSHPGEHLTTYTSNGEVGGENMDWMEIMERTLLSETKDMSSSPGTNLYCPAVERPLNLFEPRIFSSQKRKRQYPLGLSFRAGMRIK